MQKKHKLLTAVLLLLLASVVGFASTAHAAGGNGLRITPVKNDLTIKPGQSRTITVGITNVTSLPATLKVVVNDFTANKNESGAPALYLDPQAYASSHSLKKYTNLPQSTVTIQPGQTAEVPVNITIPEKTPGGGYFGAVRVSPAGVSKEADKNVTLAASVGSLILVKVPGDLKELLVIKSFDMRKKDNAGSFFANSDKLDSVVRFENKGNVQVEPFGKLAVKNMSGKIIKTIEINEGKGSVLPDSIRKFSTPVNTKLGFGKYTIEGNFGYGATGQLVSASTTFYIVPMWLTILLVVIVVLILFLIFGLPKLVRAYNKRVLRNARRQ